ncbi:hypothetical protein LTR64_000532 [Lithohypha guttulata]|uniref:uncharacterized protein n=1 Tax=Lithohypha guttulata TaxID=1690604 RepID=UPI002DE18EB5|nr:hypothetical protein LTR51_005701 [Lithohypha guttulata]
MCLVHVSLVAEQRQSGTDFRKRGDLKRKIDELADDSDLLHDLINAMHHSDDEQILQIAALAKSNAPVAELKLCLKQQIIDLKIQGRERTPEFEELRTHLEEQEQIPTRRNGLSIASLTDNPPFRGIASSWTTIADDDLLISNLVSVFFIWEGTFYNWIDRELFLEDMLAGRGQYCSSFLVNALLAFACPYSDYPEARSSNGKPSSLMSKFISEAERLLEDQPSNVATVQGIACLCNAKCIIGDDRAGYALLTRAAALCHQIQTSDFSAADIPSWLSWGVFNANTAASFFLRLPQLLPPPKQSLPSPTCIDPPYAPYPLSREPLQLSTRELLHHKARFSLVIKDMNALVAQTAYHFTVVLTLLQLISSPSADIQKLCRDAALEITKICRIYQSSYGASPTSLSLTDSIYKALFVLINEADSDGKYDSEILDLCIMFRSLGRRFPFTLAVFRTCHQVALREKSHRLPNSTAKLFEDFDREDWAATQLERVASYYPVQGSAKVDVRNIEEFFDMMKELEIGKK